MCVISTIAASATTAALASALTSAGVSATAAGITSGLVVGAGLGALDGAIVGAAGSAVTKGDVKKGALMGAATGAIGGGAIGAFNGAGAVAEPMLSAEEAAKGVGTNITNTAGTTGESIVDQGNEVQMLMMAQDGGTGANPFSPSGMAGQLGNVAPGAADGAGSSKVDYGKYASAGMQLAGGGVQAWGALEEGKENSANLKKQAQNTEVQAQQLIASAETEAKDLARRQRQTIGKGKVAAAASGIMLEGRAESSPAMFEQDAAAESAWDREKLFHNTNLRANALYAQANEYRRQSRQVRRLGNLKAATALIQGGLTAGTSFYGNTKADSIYA